MGGAQEEQRPGRRRSDAHAADARVEAAWVRDAVAAGADGMAVDRDQGPGDQER